MSSHSVIRNSWYVAGLSKDFPKETLSGHVIAKRPIVIWRTKDGDIAAFDDRCSYKRFPCRRDGWMPDGTLECAYHGLRYDTSGKCVMIPSHPTGPISPQASGDWLPVKEQDGLVWIWPGDPALAEMREPPRLPEVADLTAGKASWSARCRSPPITCALIEEPARHHAFLSAARRQHRRRRQQSHPH